MPRAKTISWADAIENVPSQRVALRQSGVIEIVGRIVGHTDSLHDSARANVLHRSKRHDFGKLQLLEAERKRRARRLGGITSSPLAGGEPPSDLDTRREVSFESRHRKANESGEGRGFRNFDRPQSESALRE